MFEIIYSALAALLVVFGYYTIRSNPHLLDGKMFLEASKTMAFLAIGLMSMVTFAIYFLRSL